MAVKGVGGTNPAIPTACVYLDWGAGKGMREVGVTDAIPTNVLLGTDLGRLVARYEPSLAPRKPALPPMDTDSIEGLMDNYKAQRVSNCESEQGSGTGLDYLKASSIKRVECNVLHADRGNADSSTENVKRDMLHVGLGNADTSSENVKCDVLHANMCPADTPNVAVVTRSGRPSLGRRLTTAAEGLSADEIDSAEVDHPEPSPQGSESATTALSLAFAADSAEFLEAVKEDSSLEELRALADNPPADNNGARVYWEEGRLYTDRRVLESPDQEVVTRRLIVPRKYRELLLQIAHEIPLAGHLGIHKTKARLTHNFYWPHMGTDIANYCRSCVACQRVGKTGDITKAPLKPLPIIEEPFQRVAVDIIGPLAIPSSSGKRFILTVVDYATRYPEAMALSSIRADKVADALVNIFTRVGFPREMLTDHGTQFMSRLMECLCQKMQVEHILASPYHPQTNGLCERFNGTLKQMLKVFVESQGRDWERYLPHLLFAYREVPQASTGFSPFELLYGRRVRGPLDLIREAWEGENGDSGVSVVEYVLKLRERMDTLMGLVQENLTQAQATQKHWYDRTARERVYEVGQKVWVLVPMRQNKLQAAWEGPYTVHKQLNKVTYQVALDDEGRRIKVYHVNMMKAHHDRSTCALPVCSVLLEGETETLVDLLAATKEPDSLRELQINPQLNAGQQARLSAVLEPHKGTFTARPGLTRIATHHVDTGSHPPIRRNPKFRGLSRFVLESSTPHLKGGGVREC